MEISVDLRPQRTKRGRIIQDADAHRVAGVLHFAAAVRGRSTNAARHLDAARQRLRAAATGYQQGGIGLAWWCAAKWCGEIERMQATFAHGVCPRVRGDETVEVMK